MGCGSSSAQNAKTTQVTNITVWTYYNGDQLESFTDLVDKFNETVGAEKGIVVSTESQGSVNDLEQSVMDAAEGKVGAPAMPNVFSAYADTVYALDQMGMVVNLAPYLTDDEKAKFIDGYLSEGDFDDNGSGFANENSLLELSPRFIKVDIAIIRGIDTDPDKQQIVQNIVAYAHPRNMQIIAEGVETAAELRKVIELGADALQGYFLAKPAAVPAQMAPAARKIIAEYSSVSDSG